jgi:hypothetical protein
VDLKINNPRYSCQHIADIAGVSESSVKRVLKQHHVSPTAIRSEVLASVRERLTEQYMHDNNIRMLFANQAVTALNQIALANSKMDAAWEKMNATDICDAALVFRAASNHASALRNHSECLKALFGEIKVQTQTDLPVLHIVEMSEADVTAERLRQRLEEEAINGVSTDDPDPDPEIDDGVITEGDLI